MIRTNILMMLFLAISVLAIGQIEEVSVNNISSLNTAEEDFIAIPYGKGIMYNTHVKDNKCDTCKFQNLRYAELKMGEDCSFSPGVVVPNELKAKYNYGAPTFSSDGKMMILSQNNKKPRKADRRLTMKLVKAQLSDQNKWTNVMDLPLNGIDFETTHPSLSVDGQTLIFSSDRPGGQGDMDLWMVQKQGDTWSTPTNLGANINTAGKEVFPYLAKDGMLYFSSDKAGGQGQLDIYATKLENGTWSSPENLGRPINSSADDLGYTVLEGGEAGYLTSNRGGGKGKDDLYCWKINKAPVMLAVEDANTSKRLPNAKITVKGPVQTMTYNADANGSAEPDITFRKTYTINVEKEGYQPWTKAVSAKELAAVETYIVPLMPRAYQMVGDVKLIGSETMVPEAKVVLHNLTTGEKREFIADANGKFRFDNIHCVEDYELIAYKDDRESERYALPASKIDCASTSPTSVTLRLPVPPPTVPVCACNDAEGPLSLPTDQMPKSIHTLGSRPQFGNSHALDATGFYQKLQKRYNASKRDATFLDDLFKAMGYANGFADVDATAFTDTVIANGSTGNMGSKAHRIKYIQLNAKRDRDLQAFKVTAANGCDVHFMKTCGNMFFFCSK